MLSFVIPAFNAEATLAATVESVMDQELDEPYEVVVADDASSDGTPELLESLADEHRPLRSVRHRVNRGGAAARNTAVREAGGSLVYMVDSDNVLPPGVVQAQVNELRRVGLHAASVEALHFFRDDPAVVSHEWRLAHTEGRSGIDELFSTTRVPASHGNYLYTRELFEAVDGYDEGSGAADAWTFGMKHVVRGFEVAIARGTFYLHRAGHESYWIREARKGANDRHALNAVRQQSSHLPPQLRDKVSRLHRDDPFLEYVDAGFFKPDGALPSATYRMASRWRRRLGGALAR